MADDLNVILKAILDVSESKKDIAVLLNTINKDPSLNKVKLGVDFDSSQLKGAVVEIRELFDVVEGQLKIKKEVETVQNSIGKLTKNITEYNKEGIKYSEEHINKQKEQNKYREKAIQLEKELSIASEKFTNKNLSDVYKYGSNIDVSAISNIREQFGNLTINKDGSNIEEVVNKVKLLSREYDLIIDKAKLQKTINDDLVKQEEEKYKEAKKFAEVYDKIKTKLDALPNRAIGDESKGFYTRLDSALDSNQLETLRNETEIYYKKAIALEKEYNKAVKENNKDSIKLYDDKLNKLKFITNQTSQLSKLENDIKNLQTTKGLDGTDYLSQIDNIRNQLSVIDQSDIALIKEEKYNIESIVKSLKDSVGQNKANLEVENKRKTLITEIEANLQKLNDIQKQYNIKDASKIDETRESLVKLKSAVENHETAIDSATIENKQFTNSIKDISSEAKKTSDATAKLGDRLKKAFQYFTFYDALNLAKRGFREMVGVIFELDDALVEIQKVSNLSGKSLESFTRQAYSLGAEISKSGKQVIEASTQFARAGFDESELLSLAETALKLTSIGDGLTNVSESANTLIAVMRGFGKGTDEVVSIMDAINNVSNNASVNFNDVTMALQRMSGTMNASGIDLQKSIGLFTALNEVLRNTEMSSTAINSISMRMRGLSEDGEAIDGLSPKLQKMFKDIAGIDITDSTGQVEDLYTILGKLSPVWDTLTKNQKQYIAQESSGIRQAKSFLILMDNYNRVLETTDLAYNSAGSSAEEFARWQDSLEGKLNNLKSAIEQFSSETIDSQFTKSILDATTSIVNMGTAMGGAIPVILALSGAFATFKLITFAGGISGITTAIGVLGLSISGLLPIIGLAVGVGGAIAGVATVINEVKNASKNAKAEVEALSSELKELQNNSESIGSLSKKYIELRGIKDADKTSEQWREYYNVQNQLHELLPDLNGYINEQGNFIIENVEAVSDLTDVYKEYIAEKRKERAEASKESAKYTLKQYDEEKKKLEELTEYHNLRNAYLSGKLSKEDSGRYGQLGYRYGGLKDLEAEIKSVQSTVNELSNSIEADVSNIVKATDGWGKLTEDQANAVNRAFATLSEGEQKKWLKQLSDQTLTEEELNKVTQEFIDTLIQTYPALEYLSNALKKTEDSADGTNEAVKSLEESLKSLTSTRSDIESLSNILNNLNEGSFTAEDMEKLLSVSEEFLPYLNDEIALREKLNEVINKNKSTYKATYEYMILLSSDTYKILTSKIEDYFNGLGIAYKDDLKNYKDLETAKATISNNLIGQLGKKWAEYFSVGLNGVVQDNDLSGGARTRVKDKKLSELQKIVDGFYKIADDIQIDPITIDFGDSKIGGAKSSTDTWLETFQRLYSELKYLRDKDLITAQDYYDQLTSLNEKYFSNNAKYLDEFRQYDVELYNLAQQIAEETAQAIAEAYDKAMKTITDEVVQIDLQQQLVNDNTEEYLALEKKKYDNILAQETLLQQRIAELQRQGTEVAKAEAEELIDAYYDTVKQRYNIIANLQSTQISIYKEQIDSLNKQKDALSNLHKYTMQMIKSEYEAKKKSYQDELKGIEAVFNAKKKALRDEKDSRNYEKGLTEKSSLVADLENQLALIKNDETAIAKRKKLEEELAKAKQDLTDYQYDHSIELQEDALDRELEKAKEIYDDKIDAIDKTLSNEVRLREMADKRIQQSGQKLYKQLIDYAKEYGSITEDEIKDAWDNANISLEGYKSTQESVLNKLKEITAELSKIEGLNTQDYSNKQGLDTLSYNAKLQQMQANSAKWTSSDDNERKRLAEENQKLGKALGLTYDSSTGVWYYDKQKKIRVYHSGGIVGGSGYATKDTEELAKLLKGELVITPPQATKIMDSITNNNSESFAPTFVFQFEGSADNSLLEQFKKEAKTFANIVAEEMNKSRSNTGYKKKLKRA